jgi:hypothetical protein
MKYVTLVKSLQRIAAVTGLVVSVTVGGVMAGAFFVSPLAATTPWVLPAVAVVAIIAVMAMLTVWLEPSAALATVRIGGTQSVRERPIVATPTIASPSSFTLPGFSMGGKVDRTPKHVQALAAAGTTLTEIARRTRLPVDAVSLLLSISAAPRQLQPPTA